MSAAASSAATMQAFVRNGYGPFTEESKQKGIYKVISSYPKPTVSTPTDILIRVFAASINPIDFKLARGDIKLLSDTPDFPQAKLGYDLSGVVEQIGEQVTKFKVGDQVVARVAKEHEGTFAEYAISNEGAVARKPHNLTHSQAACLPLAGETAIQALRSAHLDTRPAPRSVFIPAALGGVGLLGIQLARHHFHAEKIVTSVSTAKIEQAKQLLAGDDLEFVDYKKENPAVRFKQQMDVVFDTTGEAASYFPMLKQPAEAAAAGANAPHPPSAVSIATIPSAADAQAFGGSPNWLIRQFLNLGDWRVRRHLPKGCEYSWYILKPNAADLTTIVELVEQNKVRPLVGKVFPLEQTVEALAAAESGQVAGKVVIQTRAGAEAEAAVQPEQQASAAAAQ